MRAMAIGLCTLALGACSMGQMVARSTLPILESGNVAMNRETDLELARAGRNQDFFPGQQRWHEISEGLAGAGTRFGDENGIIRQSLLDARRHLLLRRARHETFKPPGERPVGTENVFAGNRHNINDKTNERSE